MASIEKGLESPDPLSVLLRRVSVRGQIYARPTLCGQWRMEPERFGLPSFHLVTFGICWLSMPDLLEPIG